MASEDEATALPASPTLTPTPRTPTAQSCEAPPAFKNTSVVSAVGRSVRAVQYLRMSTEHQRYSLVNQQSAIAEYAKQRGYEIVDTYADAGKSGLSLRGRDALKRLLSDALSQNRVFDVILVLDVSRWGRFQDPDQAAHYEFICRQAGLKVAYCAEPFENDVTPITTIMKHLKRVMASEYSRELSSKLSRAHLQQASLGFRQGGSMIYGFRRALVDENGAPRFVLERGQHKALRTDHVRYVLGSRKQQEIIRTIFHLYVHEEHSLISIVRQLRNSGIPGNDGRPWTSKMVRSILTSELCVGRYVYNRTTQKLQTPLRRNPEHLWVRASATVEPLISEDTFARAQARVISRKPGRLSDEKMLEDLRTLAKTKGRLSVAIVEAAPNVPSPNTYKAHFGTFSAALKQIGYTNPVCIRGKKRDWTVDDLRSLLRTIYDQNGYLSCELIDSDLELPGILAIKRKVGPMAGVYDFIGAPPQTTGEVIRAAMARRVAMMRGSPPPRRPRRWHWSKKAMTARLKVLFAQHGYLSTRLIKADPMLPSVTTIIERFGSVMKAYRQAGWTVDRGKIATLRNLRRRRR